MRQHAGQIAFPGGRFDAIDGDLKQTALREFEEEVGVAAHQVQILGQLTAQFTSSQYVVMPFYGLVNQPYQFSANPEEVAELIEIPLSNLQSQPILTIPNLSGMRNNSNSLKHTDHMYYLKYQNQLIWGVTMTILKEFLNSKVHARLGSIL